jgi:hypothetical protein
MNLRSLTRPRTNALCSHTFPSTERLGSKLFLFPVAWGHYAGITSSRNLTEAKRIAANAINIAKGNKSPDMYPAAVLWTAISCEELALAMSVSGRAALAEAREGVVRSLQGFRV